MKKIVLKQFETRINGQLQYELYLGDDRRLQFPSKRKLIAFINKTNKFLTLSAFEVHTLYMQVWEEYQRCWFYFGQGDEKYSLHYLDQIKCDESLRTCEERLQIAIKKEWYDGNPFTFSNIPKAISLLRQVISILLPLHKKRSQTADLYRLNTLFSRLADVENKINSYGLVEATSIKVVNQFQKQKRVS
jgi:hypothetical protein